MKQLQGLLFFILMGLVGLAFGWWLGESPVAARLLAGAGELPLWGVLLLIVGAIFLTLLLHELGHLAAGLAQGFVFVLLAVGPLMVRRENGRIRVTLNRNLALFGGVAATMPKPNEPRLLQKMAWIAAAGPLSTFAVGLLSMAFILLLPASQGAGRFFFFVMALLAVAIVAATTLPTGSGGFLSDRARWQMLRRGEAEAQRWAAATQLGVQVQQGVRPRDWPNDYLKTAVSLPDRSIDDLLANLYAYYIYVDRGELAQAIEALTICIDHVEKLPSLARPSVFVEQAYFTAVFEQNAEAAREALTKTQAGILDKWTKMRAEAAVLLAEGESETAVALLEEAIAAAKLAKNNGLAVAELDWMGEMVLKIHSPERFLVKKASECVVTRETAVSLVELSRLKN